MNGDWSQSTFNHCFRNLVSETYMYLLCMVHAWHCTSILSIFMATPTLFVRAI